MDSTEEQIHLKLRQNRVKRILADLSGHKVCEQCRSIAKMTARICPLCHAYRWEYSPEAVKETAELIGKVAVPYTAPYIPRL